MYNDKGYVGIAFFAQLSNPLSIAMKKYLPLSTCVRKITISRVDMFTYMCGLYCPRNLQHVSILKGYKSKQTFPEQCVFTCLIVYDPQIHERQYCIILYV
jgi:hypothetical protein